MEERRGRRKKTKPPLQRKEEILRKTLRLFMSKGYEATTTNDICRAANMTKPTLYYYFPGKRNILHAAHQLAMEHIVRPYLDKSAALKDPLERLCSMLADYTTIVCTHPELRFLLHESLNIRDSQTKKIRKEWKRHYLLFRDTIAELQARGSIRPELKPSRAALMLIGMVTWITYWFDYRRKGTIDETVSLVIDMAGHSLGLEEHIKSITPHL